MQSFLKRSFPLLLVLLLGASLAQGHALEIASVAELIESLNHSVDTNSTKGTIHIYHIEGEAIPPELYELIKRYHAEGYEIRGTFLTREEFERKQTERIDGLNGQEIVRRILVTYPQMLPEEAQAIVGQLDPAEVKGRMRGLIGKLFGSRFGFTKVGHYVKGFFKPTEEQKQARNQALLIANSLLGLSLFLDDAQASQYFLPMAVLSGWIYCYLGNFNQIQRFKGFLKSVFSNPSRPDGQQIGVIPHRGFVLTELMVEQTLLNALLFLAIHGLDGLTATAGAKLAASGGLQAVAKYFFELQIADRMAEADRAKAQGDLETEATKRRQAIYIEKVISNILMAFLRFLLIVGADNGLSQLQLLNLDTLSWGVMVVLGGMGITYEAYQFRYQAKVILSSLFQKLFGKSKTLPCPSLLEFHAPASS